MTQLHVKPIDPAEKGSRKERDALYDAMFEIDEANEAGDTRAMYRAKRKLDALVAARCYTDDGTSVTDALDEISANDFDDLVTALLGGGADTVPPSKSTSSKNGHSAKGRRRAGATHS